MVRLNLANKRENKLVQLKRRIDFTKLLNPSSTQEFPVFQRESECSSVQKIDPVDWKCLSSKDSWSSFHVCSLSI